MKKNILKCIKTAAIACTVCLFCAGCGLYTGDTSIHVSPSGNDEKGKGTEMSPFATVSRALNRFFNNRLIGEGTAVEYNSSCRKEDMVNDIRISE